MKIIFLTDFLMHSPSVESTYHSWLIKIINSIQKYATNTDIIEFKYYKKNSICFDRNLFYKLSLIENIDEQYYLYDIEKIDDKSWNYFFDFIGEDVFIIGFELGLDLRKKLTENGINYINFWIHSFKLFDDIAFLINTNNENIFKELQNYKIPKLKFQIYTDYWKANIFGNTRHIKPQYDAELEDNSVLFIGQTFKDKSVQKDNKFLNILDFKDRLAELSKEYKKIYYSPHPFVFASEEVDNYINSIDYIEKIDNIPTYYLLSSEKIKKVISISSSVVYEAQYFGKETEYLYQPLFNIDGEFGLNTFISVIDDYYNPKFWSKILSPVMQANSNVPDEILIKNTTNKIRNVVGCYWGFSYLDDTKKIETQLLKLQNQQIELNKNVASEFVELNKKIEKVEEKQPHIYKRIKKDNKVTSYLLGIPIYKRKNTKIYIVGIPVWNKDWNNKFFSTKNTK